MDNIPETLVVHQLLVTESTFYQRDDRFIISNGKPAAPQPF